MEAALAIRCFEFLEDEPGPRPICKDVRWYQENIKVVACDHERSAELYKSAVSKAVEQTWWRSTGLTLDTSLNKGTGAYPENASTMQPQSSHTRPEGGGVERGSQPGGDHPQKGVTCPNRCCRWRAELVFSSVYIKVYKSDAAAEECPEHPELEGYASDASTIMRDLKALVGLLI